MKTRLRLTLMTFLMISLSHMGTAQCTNPVWVVDEDFSGLGGNTLPDCWTIVGNSTVFTSDGNIGQFWGTGVILNLPETQNATGVLTFRARNASNFTYSGLTMDLGVYDGSTFTKLFTVDFGQNFYKNYSYDFSSYTGSGKQIAFRGGSSGTSFNRMLFDDVHYQSTCNSSSSATAIAKDITVQLDATGNVIVNPSQVDNGSINSCEAPITNLSLDKTLFTCDDLGDNTVTLTADDGFGNTATATATITVEPSMGITFSAISLDETGQYELTTANGLTSGTTDCSSITYSFSQSTFTCADLGGVTVVLTATYPGGTATTSRSMSIIDELDPVAVAQDLSVTINETTGIATITPQMADNGSSDNCTIASMELSKSTFDCSDQGENTVELTVTDDSGRTNTTSFTVTVESFIPDVTVTSDNTTLCFDGSNSSGATISTNASTVGVEYSLRKSADNSVIDGPLSGTGSGLSFNTGTVSENTTYHIFAEVPFSGKALSLSSSSAHLAVNTPASFDYSTGYTFSGWVKESLGGISNSFDPIFYAGGTTGSDIEVYLNSNTGALTLVHNRGNGGSNDFLLTANTLLPNNEFAHLAVTYDGTTARIFVNGEEKASKVIPAPVKSAGSELTFGYLNNTGFPGFQSFNGSLDDIRIYDAARSGGDISSDMGRCIAGTESNLVLYYDMEAISGTIMTDKVSSTPGQVNNNGTLTDDGAISCSFICNRIMSTEITVGDDAAPTAVAKNITIQQGTDGTVQLNASDIDNGSSDNCTSTENLTFSLDVSEFGCDDTGANTVTMTVTDEAGNSATATSTVTITPAVTDQTVTTASASVCPGSDAVISMSGSQTGISYYLRNQADEDVAGPITGTGQAIDFNTGAVNSAETYHVYAQLAAAADDAMQLAGSYGYVAIPNSTSLQLDENWTIEAWVKPTGTVLNVVETYNASGGYILRTNGTKWQAYAMRTNASFSIVTSATSIVVGEWTHVAATFNETTNQLKIYVNGVLDASNLSAGVDQRGSTTTIKLGARGDDNAVQGEQMQDEVRIWNVERTAQQIMDNKSALLSGSEPGLMAYYDYNNLTYTATGMIIPDLTANGNDGTMGGSYVEANIVDGPLLGQTSVCGLQVGNAVTLTPEDTEAPTAVAQNISVRLDINNQVTVLPEDVDNGSGDNCGNITMTLELPASGNSIKTVTNGLSFGETDLGDHTVNLIVEDQAGLSSTASAVVTILEYKQEQTISFGVIEEKIYGVAPFALSATSSSGLAVSFSVKSGPASLSGNTLTITGAGTVTVEASQAGDAQYAPQALERTFAVNQAALIVEADNQTITYGDAIPTLTFNYDGFVNGEDATALSAEPTISTTAAGAEGLPNAGSYPIQLSGGASANYSFMLIDGTLTINKADQALTLAAIDDKLPTDGPFDVTTTIDSGLPISFEITGPASISGTTVTLDGTEGTVTLTATQTGDLNHNSASITQSFEVRVPLSVEDDLLESIKVYPNPVVEYLNIDAKEKVDIKFFSVDGRLVKSLRDVNGKILLHGLKAGSYILEMTTENQRAIKRIIKAN